MRCLQLVLWRGAMALSLVVAGVGSGYGLYAPPVCSVQPGAACFEVAAAHRVAGAAECIDTSGDRVRFVLEQV